MCEQGVFEGMKAYTARDGRILIFRPQENGERMIRSADRMSMPAPSVEAFVAAVKQTVAANKRWVSGLKGTAPLQCLHSSSPRRKDGG